MEHYPSSHKREHFVATLQSSTNAIATTDATRYEAIKRPSETIDLLPKLRVALAPEGKEA